MTIFLHGIPEQVSLDELRALTNKFGTVTRIAHKSGYKYAFIDYSSGEEEDRAISNLHGTTQFGMRIGAEKAKKSPAKTHNCEEIHYKPSEKSPQPIPPHRSTSCESFPPPVTSHQFPQQQFMYNPLDPAFRRASLPVDFRPSSDITQHAQIYQRSGVYPPHHHPGHFSVPVKSFPLTHPYGQHPPPLQNPVKSRSPSQSSVTGVSTTPQPRHDQLSSLLHAIEPLDLIQKVSLLQKLKGM
ncbi:hypothetical protein ADUPG1_010619, partial [Aduncisulcus paluster]